MKNILCFGDSNTHGYNGDTCLRFDLKDRWSYKLQQLLGSDYYVIEEGLSGRTTCFDDPLHESLSGIDHIYPILMSHEPVDLLIIMLGTNDTKQRFGVSGQAIGIAMQRLIKKAKSIEDAFRDNKPNILVVCPKDIEIEYEKTECALPMGFGCAQKSHDLHEAYQNACKLLNVHYLNANDYVTKYNTSDYMHLTIEGNIELSNALYNKIKEIFNEK